MGVIANTASLVILGMQDKEHKMIANLYKLVNHSVNRWVKNNIFFNTLFPDNFRKNYQEIKSHHMFLSLIEYKI